MDVHSADNITIRAATADDADVIHTGIMGIALALGQPSRVTSTAEDIRHHGFGDNPAFHALLAEVDGAFAGLCLYFASFSTWYGKPGVYVQDLYVEPSFRGQGVADKLMQHLASLSRDEGGTYIRLSVDSDNVSAQGFYERLGLNWSKGERIFVARGESFLALAQADGDEQ